MVSFLAKVKMFRFGPKTMGYVIDQQYIHSREMCFFQHSRVAFLMVSS